MTDDQGPPGDGTIRDRGGGVVSTRILGHFGDGGGGGGEHCGKSDHY